VQVQTRSASGDYFYYVINDSSSAGKWRVVSGGPGPQIGTIYMNGRGMGNFVMVNGGLGLIGGSLSTGPDKEFLDSYLRRDAGAGSTNSRPLVGLAQGLMAFDNDFRKFEALTHCRIWLSNFKVPLVLGGAPPRTDADYKSIGAT